MSDTNLLGILRMPPNTWRNDELDIAQRYSLYLQAAEKIENMTAACEAALDLLESSLVVEGYLVVRRDINEVKTMLRDGECYFNNNKVGNCPFSAHDFHDWLIENGYKIVREKECRSHKSDIT